MPRWAARPRSDLCRLFWKSDPPSGQTPPLKEHKAGKATKCAIVRKQGTTKLGKHHANNSPGSGTRSTWQPLKAPPRLTV